ncbi:7-alpha-hydroxycholest-4-en-3-one 12-alpha-hydroxylase-like [Eublepharis macularius]|uniref:7-alpha-hydroxycholest-4-en-3-one 12-alpha-hydroxylase-like n=1 Tax=Eublepharis macularius TaxID=481883 RepID=A0AA97K0C7_EUBMA|nr:7-alpha-hydroxycholest-4-en-3-one 12-alpha-hydroxylase-like [Eublepharis macularius]
MALWEAILCAFLAATLGGLYLAGAFRKQRANEPPLEKGIIPWLGCALEFRRDGVEFLRRMQKKHGTIFTVLLGGSYFTFLMDPLSFKTVVKEARAKLSFTEFAEELVQKVFGYRPSLMTHKIIESASTKHLNGNGLVVMTQAMMDSLQMVMLHSLGSAEVGKPWKEDGLFHYCYNMVFRAGYLALYGNEPRKSKAAQRNDLQHSEEIYEEFRKYDQLFPRLATSTLSYGNKKEAERLKRLFWGILSMKNVQQKDNVSEWVREQEQQLAEEGMPEYMRDRFMFLLLWPAQSNTGPASFWLLLHLMKNPKAMEEVRKEVDRVVKESGQEVKPGSAVINVTKEMLTNTPVLDSAVQETLRLAAAPLLIRAVMEDVELKMNDGREYALRKGDRVGIFPYLAAHMDPEIHPEPHVFKYDRFLNQNGTKREFYKNGEKVKYCTMPWGAGTSMCPGRFFAVNKLKLFVFMMLTYFDMELVNKEEDFPPLEKSRYGIGVMQPEHDIQFR